MTTDNPLLERVRKLLAKAESEGTTPAEAEALTAKAAELMARYGIDRALLAAQQPGTDRPADRKIDVDSPWARVQGHLLCGLAAALRCQCVILPRRGPGTRIHVFLCTSEVPTVKGTARPAGMCTRSSHRPRPAVLRSRPIRRCRARPRRPATRRRTGCSPPGR